MKPIDIFEISVIILVLALFVLACLLNSCGLTRIQSTEAKFYQRGDTTVQIVTKTSTNIDAKTSVPITSLLH